MLKRDRGWAHCLENCSGSATKESQMIIKGAEMLDKPGESVFHSGPGVHGGYETFLPFVAPSKGGKP